MGQNIHYGTIKNRNFYSAISKNFLLNQDCQAAPVSNQRKSRKPSFVILAIILCLTFVSNAIYAFDPKPSFLNPLRSRGFSLIPAPQSIDLKANNIVVDGSWSLNLKVRDEDIAVKRLIQGAKELHNLRFNANGRKNIILSVKPGTVKGTNDSELNKQGYFLKITPEKVEITGNSNVGLYYGVQSLLQLLRRDNAGQLILPEGEIRDWPTLQLRFVHWDTKHHQKRMETMKRLIDWHAFFKVNMISFETEDKYEYPRHPVIGAPGAYTKTEMQELTRYASERHIQLVPNVQSPAHMAYVLKHKEFDHLKSDGSNYQICMCDPEAIDLIFDMYQDMIDATPGVDYFLVSTDELYYAGICAKCKDPYNEENRSLAWADFATKAHNWLAKKNRRMIAWVEYPLLPKHITLLPPGIINGVMGNDKEFLEQQKKTGMRQLAYSSTQGAEFLFPNHFSSQYNGRETEGRLYEIARTIPEGLAAGANPIGTFGAAWDDSGLHEETFHLGWATVTQYGWNPYGSTVEQSVADFMDVFYGPGNQNMVPVYKLLIEGAQFFNRSWDKVTSKERGPGYGNSYGPGIGTRRTDEVLGLPEIPSPGTLEISGESKFSDRYSTLIAEAEKMKMKNDELLFQLTQNIGRVERNHYNLEVFLSIAYLERYFINTVLALRDAENLIVRANAAASQQKPAVAVANLTEASNRIGELINWGDWMWKNLEATWEKSRMEKGRSLNGRDFVHVLDDVKDHWADRRKGLDYMIAPFQRMDLQGWRKNLNERINNFAKDHNIPLKGLEQVRLED